MKGKHARSVIEKGEGREGGWRAIKKEGCTEEKKVIKMKEGKLMKNSWMGGVKISEVKQEAGRRGRMERWESTYRPRTKEG